MVASTWEYESAIVRLALEHGETVEISLPVDNLLQETLYVEVATVDLWNHEPGRKYNPWRLIYLFGSLGQGVRDWWRTIIDDAGAPLEVGEDLANQPPVACDDGNRVEVASTDGATLLFLGGEPIREPIAGYGPFVMNTEQEIREAIADYQAGRMGDLEKRAAR